MSKIRFRRKNWLIAGSIGALVAFVISGIGAYFAYGVSKDSKANYEKKIQEAEGLIKSQNATKKLGWIMKEDIKAGEIIEETDLRGDYIPESIAPENILTDKKELVGKTIKINALKNTVLTKEMVYGNGALDPGMRKQEVDYVRLPYRITPTDTVDVRIVFPNGEDFIVVAKKRLKDVDFDAQMMFMEVNNEELTLLQSALVDAYINQAELYAIQYVEPEMQPAPIANYVPNIDVLRTMKVDPTITNKAKYDIADKLRQGLEERLKTDNNTNTIRIGSEPPAGSGAVKRKKTLGPGAQLVNPSGQTGTQPPANNATPPNTSTTNNAGSNGQSLLGG